MSSSLLTKFEDKIFENLEILEIWLPLGYLFEISHISSKRWLSDKVKENCKTSLKVHYYAVIIKL